MRYSTDCVALKRNIVSYPQNGFLLFHPAMWMDENYLEDPAHVDISSVEGENTGKEIKTI